MNFQNKAFRTVIAYPSIIFLLFMLIPASKAQNTPINLRCCEKASPVGTDDTPFFGWYMNDIDDNEIQTAYQILVASNLDAINANTGDVWNSDIIASGKQNFIYYEGSPLESAKRYYWKVRIYDKDGNASPYSEPATFETGLFTNKDWSGAKWIKRSSSTNEDFTYYRKTFALNDTGIQRATVYITAVHDCELYLNGNLVGKGPTYHYPQYQYYNAFDITDLLKEGTDNTFACLTHWYGGGQGRPTSEKGLLMKTVIEYSNSDDQIIGTDASWLQKQVMAWKTGQKKRNGEGIGFIEKIDSRDFLPDWNKNSYDDTGWDASVEIGEHPVSPWTGVLQPNLTRLIEEEIAPVSVTDLGTGTYIIDLGKVYAGLPKITFYGGTAGDVVNIRGGYTLNATGTVSTTTTQNTDMKYYFILNGDTAVFQPMIYLGMRYIQIDNSPNVLNTENVRFISRHYNLDQSRSEFTSSNEMLNRVWDLMKHSLILGSQESFVDTPTREKGGFLGDSWSIGAAAMSTMGDRAMNLRILLEFLDSQDQYWPDGRLNAVYPNVDGARDIPDYTQMYLVWVWDYFMQSGDLEFLRNNYSKIKKVAEYVDNYRNETTGLIHNLAGGGGSYEFGIIDWPDQMRYGYDMTVESRTVQDVYAYLGFQVISNIAEVIDSTDDKELFQQKADDMKAALNDLLITNEGYYCDGIMGDQSQSTHISQQANMFPMATGIVPEENQDTVIYKIKELKMSSGMVTIRMLPEAIGNAGDGVHLLRLYTNNTWDGWAKTISLGGTATWEAWDANFQGQSMSHPWGAVGLLGLQQYFLGVKALKPQHELVQIKPLDFKYRLKNVSGILPTDRGDIEINWTRSNDVFTMNFTIPDNMKAKVYVPMCGIPDTSVTVDGVDTVGVQEGDFIYVGEFESGSRTIERNAEIVELSNECSASIETDVASIVKVSDDIYTLDIVRGDASEIYFTVTPTHDGATVSGDIIFNISDMQVGSSDDAIITVTAEDGTTTCVYTITVNILPSSDCTARFKVDEGKLRKIDAVTYTVNIDEGVTTTLNFTVTPTNDGASVSGDTVFDISGIEAGSSDNAIITVTAEDETTECVYTITVNVLEVVGVESSIMDKIKIFPNPAHNTLNIENIENAKISVYGIDGVLKRSIDAVNNDIEIDLTDYNTGIYILKIQMDEGLRFDLVVKE